MSEGLILKGIAGFYYVKSDSNVYECKPRGIFRKEDIAPVAGDLVEISVIDEQSCKGIIEKVRPRKNVLIRPPVANVDQVILVFAVRTPDPDFMLLDKLLVRVCSLDIKPILCVNKIDLDKDKSLVGQFSCYSRAGFKTVLVSSHSGAGIEELKSYLAGNMSILAGPSGTGKSTILNRLNIGSDARIGSLSEKIERGKHTTRHVELFETPDNGYLADTPGFSSFSIDDIEKEDLQSYYPEFNQYRHKCRFSGCKHIAEPACAVKEAMANGIIDQGRYSRFKQLYESLKKNVRF